MRRLEPGLTAHCLVRSEPLVFYAVQAVVGACDRVLLWDTGSGEGPGEHTLEDCRALAAEHPKKVDLREVPIETDERGWTSTTHREHQARNRGKRGKGVVRLEMIEATRTSHFVVVDGDEVHRAATAGALRRCALEGWPAGKLAGFVPLLWHCSLGKTFRLSPRWGRLFLTSGVGMMTESPGEMHTCRRTGDVLRWGDERCFAVPGAEPCAHFETWLKPWRRQVPPGQVRPAPALPEVMRSRQHRLLRYMRDRETGRATLAPP